MEEYLEMQDAKKLPTSMAEIFRASTVQFPMAGRKSTLLRLRAQLIYAQKVTIRYAGNTIQPGDPETDGYAAQKSEIGKTSISKRKPFPLQ